MDLKNGTNCMIGPEKGRGSPADVPTKTLL